MGIFYRSPFWLPAGCRVAALAFFLCLSCATQNSAEMAQKLSPGTVKFFLPSIISGAERKLAKTPGDWKLSLEAGSYCIMNANAFIQGPASMLPPGDYQKRDKEYRRAKKEYLRGVTHLRSAWGAKYPGINEAFGTAGFKRFLDSLSKDDVEMLYWLVAGTMAAFSLDPFDVTLSIKLPELSALILRAYELQPDWNNGTLDDFFILFYGALPADMGGDKNKAKIHYERALKKAAGRSAGPYVSWAEAICVPAQNYSEFKQNLDAALAIDPDAYPPLRLNNIITQRKARYLLDSAKYKFIDIEE
ncbi:MAG: TRAP transporter TatT component family protein [Spirochaetaceae bacterium]|jgi:predicted anti-sigma-YlaC factor YlaD|nr:TRAP transporter TatT component family protein [Spirochaetaceae bacterium]